jgi:hypothetical protein
MVNPYNPFNDWLWEEEMKQERDIFILAVGVVILISILFTYFFRKNLGIEEEEYFEPEGYYQIINTYIAPHLKVVRDEADCVRDEFFCDEGKLPRCEISSIIDLKNAQLCILENEIKLEDRDALKLFLESNKKRIYLKELSFWDIVEEEVEGKVKKLKVKKLFPAVFRKKIIPAKRWKGRINWYKTKGGRDYIEIEVRWKNKKEEIKSGTLYLNSGVTAPVKVEITKFPIIAEGRHFEVKYNNTHILTLYYNSPEHQVILMPRSRREVTPKEVISLSGLKKEYIKKDEKDFYLRISYIDIESEEKPREPKLLSSRRAKFLTKDIVFPDEIAGITKDISSFLDLAVKTFTRIWSKSKDVNKRDFIEEIKHKDVNLTLVEDIQQSAQRLLEELYYPEPPTGNVVIESDPSTGEIIKTYRVERRDGVWFFRRNNRIYILPPPRGAIGVMDTKFRLLALASYPTQKELINYEEKLKLFSSSLTADVGFAKAMIQRWKKENMNYNFTRHKLGSVIKPLLAYAVGCIDRNVLSISLSDIHDEFGKIKSNNFNEKTLKEKVYKNHLPGFTSYVTNVYFLDYDDTMEGGPHHIAPDFVTYIARSCHLYHFLVIGKKFLDILLDGLEPEIRSSICANKDALFGGESVDRDRIFFDRGALREPFLTYTTLYSITSKGRETVVERIPIFERCKEWVNTSIETRPFESPFYQFSDLLKNYERFLNPCAIEFLNENYRDYFSRYDNLSPSFGFLPSEMENCISHYALFLRGGGINEMSNIFVLQSYGRLLTGKGGWVRLIETEEIKKDNNSERLMNNENCRRTREKILEGMRKSIMVGTSSKMMEFLKRNYNYFAKTGSAIDEFRYEYKDEKGKKRTMRLYEKEGNWVLAICKDGGCENGVLIYIWREFVGTSAHLLTLLKEKSDRFKDLLEKVYNYIEREKK